MCVLSHAGLFATPRTVASQAPLSMQFPRQENWSRLPFPTPGDLPDPGIKPTSLMSPGLAGGFLPSESPRICLQYRKPRSRPRVRKSLWIREWLPTPVLLPEKSHGQRSLAGYSPWGHKESDTTERLTL